MKVKAETIQKEFSRDTYWGRIYFESEDESQKTTVVFCVSNEFLWDHFHAHKIEEVQLDKWHKEVIEKWEKLGDEIFDKPVHYDIYANTDEGRQNGWEFLEEKITPQIQNKTLPRPFL